MTCSSRCVSGPHKTYGECLRAKGIQVADVTAHHHRVKQEYGIKQYVDARMEGMQPATVHARDVDHARFMSTQIGQPFRADAPISQISARKE